MYENPDDVEWAETAVPFMRTIGTLYVVSAAVALVRRRRTSHADESERDAELIKIG